MMEPGIAVLITVFFRKPLLGLKYHFSCRYPNICCSGTCADTIGTAGDGLHRHQYVSPDAEEQGKSFYRLYRRTPFFSRVATVGVTTTGFSFEVG